MQSREEYKSLRDISDKILKEYLKIWNFLEKGLMSNVKVFVGIIAIISLVYEQLKAYA